MKEDKNKFFFYEDILIKSVQLEPVENITQAFFEVKNPYDIREI